MNRIAVELDNKLRSLDVDRARDLESLVRDAIAQVDRETVTSSVTKERKEALAHLIGVWKTDKPLGDEDVNKMLDQQRTAKYG